MAQKRYYDFENELISYDFARLTLGLHRAGRYAGFDTLVPESVLSFRIDHTQTGITTTNTLGNAVGPLGIAVSNQGVVIEEDDTTPVLSIDTNVGNGSTRYDLVVMNHTYTSLPGGTAATYSIIKGPLNNPTFPTLTNPQTQVILGFITIPAGASIVTPDYYSKALTPDNGGEPDAKLNEINVYTKLQQFKKGTDVGPTFDLIATGEKVFTLPTDGNTFRISGTLEDLVQGLRFSDTTPQEGCRITLILTPGIGIFNNKELTTIATDAGYKSVYIPKSFQDIGGHILSPGTGEEKVVDLMFYSNKFFVTYVTNTIGGQSNQKVSASVEDNKPGVLYEKLAQTDYIGYQVLDDAILGKVIAIRVKGKENTWDNVWKNINPSLDTDHSLVSGYSPRYKLDYFGKLTIRDFAITRISSLASGAGNTATLTTLPISLPKDVMIPIRAVHAQGPYGLWANLKITSGGVVQFEYNYHNLGAYANPQTGIQMFCNNLTVDITLNPG